MAPPARVSEGFAMGEYEVKSLALGCILICWKFFAGSSEGHQRGPALFTYSKGSITRGLALSAEVAA